MFVVSIEIHSDRESPVEEICYAEKFKDFVLLFLTYIRNTYECLCMSIVVTNRIVV